MIEVSHYHNQRPVYESGNGEIFEWDNPMAVSGETNKPSFPNYHPVIFDIETSAELGQKPILCVAYDTLSDRLVILYQYNYQGFTLEYNKAEEIAEEYDIRNVVVDNLTISKFEEYILHPIAEWNDKSKKRKDNERKSLVAHNAEFDIPMMGTPDDELLDNPKIDNKYEMAVQYDDYKMIGHRAGQFGQIFTFLDSSNNYEAKHIPVGDTLVGANSLWIPPKSSASLKNCCEYLDIDIEVSESETHGDLSIEYLEYCVNDVIATEKLYYKLNARITTMFGKFPIEHVYSTASIGKYVLRKMGYKRVGYSQNAVDTIAPAYFGGRTEAMQTGEIIEGLDYTDILSEYPTVSKLTNVWQFMQAKKVTIKEINPNNLPEIKDLTNPKAWEEIANYYVKIVPNGATLPIRTPHIEDTTKVITSHTHSDNALQYHYMDILAADLIDNESKYEIVQAWEVEKHGKQDLESAEIGGVEIKPYDNVMAKSIESRKEIQNEEGKNTKTKSLKITANSLYGVSAERIVKENGNEEIGKQDYASERGFYNPHVATTITAGGRLMIALGESKIEEYGGELLYCDTDSLIMSQNVSEKVINDFRKLNPYEGYAGTLDVLEKEKSGNLYAVGTKKYIFFSESGKPLEVKEHGLGNYENLRGKLDGEKIVNRLWATIMYYHLGHNPLESEILYGKLQENVLWSFNASTRSMRKVVEEMTNQYVRYGDWLQSTLSKDSEIRYIALNIEEKEPTETICKIETEGEEIVSVDKVTKQKMKQDKALKTVEDVIHKFIQDTTTEDKRPAVKVTDTKAVTKEATNRIDIFMANLEKQFNKNMGVAVEFLDY